MGVHGSCDSVRSRCSEGDQDEADARLQDALGGSLVIDSRIEPGEIRQ